MKVDRMSIIEKVSAILTDDAIIVKGTTIVVGLSGGADSVTLLHCLYSLKNKLGFDLCAVHVHHGLRGAEADRDRDFSKQLCQNWNIPFVCFSYDVEAQAQAQGKGLEEMGRELRYQAFNEVASRFPCSYIATAHTTDDHIETVLLHLCRGCGLHGLTGMSALRDNILRPLIDCHRNEIEEYCHQHALAYVNDSTNEDNRYTRNRIRHQLIPLLSQIHPHADEAILRLSAQAKQTEQFLQTLAAPVLKCMKTDNPVRFHRNPLLKTEPFLCSFILQEMMRKRDIMVSESHILAMCQTVREGGMTTLPGGITFEVSRSFIFLIDKGSECATYDVVVLARSEYEQKLNISKELFKNCCDYDMICGDAQIRYRLEGDAYRPVGRGCQKTLRKLFNENEVPKQMRSTVPLVCDERGIVIVGGFGCDERVAITPNTKRILMLKKMEE